MGKCLAIITARGGSKRIPRKNIKKFLGKPIIEYPIKAAKIAGCFDEIMVSTDDVEIAEVARRAGASVPFFRSEKNSDDFATTSEVIFEVIETYSKLGHEFEFVACIYPTAPLITAKKLQSAFQTFVSSEADSLVPIVEYSFPIERSFHTEGEVIKMNWPENKSKRSQDFTPNYHDAGQFYFLRTESFRVQQEIFTESTIPMVLSQLEVQDIDNQVDWELAEMKYQLLNKTSEV